ncbi:MAG: glycosyltransferase family 2 protein [Spirochaetia bacterium]|nr:glycosyltransferase family 2 protein [Spirochaetia bacterium]
MDTNEPLVDVVIPVYNRDNLLLECIHSVINQTYEHLSIYVIEDGSDVVAKYFSSLNNPAFAKSSKSISYIRLNTNHGVSYCRNLGASIGKGQYIAFLDSDDQWDKFKISRQLEYLENNPGYKWIHTNEIWQRNGVIINQKKEHKKEGGQFMKRLFQRCLISPSSVMFSRSFFESCGGFLHHFPVAEDYELWLRLNLKNPVAFVDEPLTIKRAGNWSQLSKTPEIDKWRVLAMHRLYRMYKNDQDFIDLFEFWKIDVIKKTQILIKGAEKYGHLQKLQKYQNWLKVFNTF